MEEKSEFMLSIITDELSGETCEFKVIDSFEYEEEVYFVILIEAGSQNSFFTPVDSEAIIAEEDGISICKVVDTDSENQEILMLDEEKLEEVFDYYMSLEEE